jgi:hypothetical protein
MSFDFDLKLPDSARDPAEERLRRLAGAEIHGAGDRLFVAFSGTDAQLRKLYATLVKLAAGSGGSLHNLQTGQRVDLSAPSGLPDGWVSAPKTVGGAYAAVLESVVAEALEPLGFAWRDKQTVMRRSDDLEQGVYFQKLTGRSAGMVRVHGYWTPLHDGPDTDTGSGMASIFWQRELKCDKAGLPKLPGALTDALNVRVLPWMMRFRTIRQLIDGFEGGTLTVFEAFGTNLVAEMASCYLTVGEPARGIERLRTIRQLLVEQRPTTSGDDQAFASYVEATGRLAEETIAQRFG